MTRPATVEGDEPLRLFLALLLPPDVRAALAAWAGRELRRGGRLVPAEQIHVTLAFLGARPAGELDAIAGALEGAAAACPPFELGVSRYRETRSVGMVVLDDPSGAAVHLADDLHGRLEALGVYRREARPWLPHATVLRFRERPGLRPAQPPPVRFAPSEAAAYLSRLHPSGARYEVLRSTPLGGP